MTTHPFIERAIRKISTLEVFHVWQAWKEIKKAQPAVDRYMDSATSGMSEEAFQDFVRATYGALQAAQEKCSRLRRLSKEHLDALQSKIAMDLELLERVEDPEYLMKHYSWLGPLAKVIPSARQSEKTEEHHQFLVHVKTILDAFAHAERLSPPFSAQNVHSYEIRISLADISPDIYRKVRLSGAMKLNQLHKLIQAVMGWKDYHLHSFEMDGIEFGIYEPEEEMNFVDEKKFRLEELAQGQAIQIKYVYDFGDHWIHILDVTPAGELSDAKSSAVCLEGARTCPPEDCGGSHGYTRMLKILNDPDHEEYEDFRNWLPRNFDPEKFDLDRANRALKRLVR